MKKSEAEKLICPFMSTYYPSSMSNKERGYIKCITTRCMLWVDSTPKAKEPKDGDLKGYCQRNNNE